MTGRWLILVTVDGVDCGTAVFRGTHADALAFCARAGAARAAVLTIGGAL